MIRFYNGRVLAMNGSYDVTADEVWTDGAKICYVGPAKQEMPAFEREIDLKGNLLMPGFKDAHTHSAMTFCRSLADDVPLQPWLFEQIFPLEEKLTPERVYHFTKAAIMEYLTSGITAAFDMYFFRLANAQSAADCGFRYVLCGMNCPVEQAEDEYVKCNSMDPLISLIPGIHAEYTTGVEEMEIIRDLCHRHKAPFFTHISETASEHEECKGRHGGMTPTELYESLGLFDYGGGGYHCCYLSDRDMEIFKNRGLYIVANPASNAKLASGIAPLQKYLGAGLNLSLGTDGPSSNNALDMFREMYLACVLQKLQNADAAAGDALKILSAAVSGGAMAMGLADCDCIAVGKQADMIVIDLQRPSMQPIINIPKNLVYSGGKDCVKMTMVAGKVLYENGEFFIGEDAEKVYATVQAEMEKMRRE